MDLEKIATSAIVSTISKTDTLSGFINDGDKEPCWDGNIYIHEDSKHSKQNIRRIPTQVKGKAVNTKSVQDIIKYRVKHDDLKAYMMDGGTLYFVVYIEAETGEVLQIYYAALLPIRIMKILEKSKNSYAIPFENFPEENKKKIEIVIEAYNEAKRQKSYAGKSLPTIDELSQKGVLESISLHITHVGKEISPSIIPQVMEGKGFTIYANIKGNPIGIPVEWYKKVTHVTTCQTIYKTIYINKIAYYNHYNVQYSASYCKSIIGNCLTITAPLSIKEDIISVPVTIEIEVKGTLKEQIKGFEFIQAVFDNNGYEIEETHIPINLKEKGLNEKIKEFAARLDWLKYIYELLESMHIKKDLEIQKFSEDDKKNLNYLIAAIGERKPVQVENKKLERLQLLKISNIEVGVIYLRHANGYYYMHDYFGDRLEAYGKINDKKTRISQFALVTMGDLIKYDNVYPSMIVEDFKLLPHSAEVINEANLVMLQMIKAYDQSKNYELLDASKQLNEWLLEYPELIENEICIINGCQIKIRKEQLNYRDKAALFHIADKSENMSYRVGAFILLGEIDEANKIFASFSEKQMNEFKNYPIYKLYKQSGAELKHSNPTELKGT